MNDTVRFDSPCVLEPLRYRALDIDTWQEHVIYLHRDCAVCRAEGFRAQARVQVQVGARRLIATVNVVGSGVLGRAEAALSASASGALEARAGDLVYVTHAPGLESLRWVRAKVYGNELAGAQLDAIMQDVASGSYTGVPIAAFLAACAGGRMTERETIDLTRAMIGTGERLSWNRPVVADKHCVGGLPGNRTSPIVVAVAAAAGLLVPKTSSRAITSPAGTADTMAVLTRVDLDAATLRQVVEQAGASLAWGGALGLSPADDMLIQVERALDLDSDAQLVASILSKKVAAGSTHVLIDVPVGPTAKVREEADLERLRSLLTLAAQALGVRVRIVRTDGTQPVGRGIGPALEARDVLAVLQGAPSAPHDLRERSLMLAGELMEFCGACGAGEGAALAAALLAGGAAWTRFQAICEAQGGLRAPGRALFLRDVPAPRDGVVATIDNRRLARAARLAGAPERQVAGIDLHVRLGDTVRAGQPLLTLHAQASGELAYAGGFLAAHPAIVIGEAG
ncbi:thymidine phosphorylase family protein [Cupriavidus malaysiensis]|uniref:Putative thymidine phosphorylase n=1 Tax=Cupriavidus malaysiensis TaxID=367825 RepID=A0ABN4TVI1_9BURK|nr:thymidine phosphorylase family protein [Cupriavidus malaysiensis]AOZ10524.1 thymidine phosphorylase [Cupriavidus malaysiensis]